MFTRLATHGLSESSKLCVSKVITVFFFLLHHLSEEGEMQYGISFVLEKPGVSLIITQKLKLLHSELIGESLKKLKSIIMYTL